jgi:uncharacterized membrane protein
MTARRKVLLFVAVIVLAALFVASTTRDMPQIVASHFDAAGFANGHMDRTFYLTLLLVLVIGAPLLIAYLPYRIAAKRSGRLNIPHRSYWLAPEREAQTRSFLWQHGLWFGALLAVFLAYMHWLVVLANRLQPPRMATAGIVLGLAVFCGGLGVWLVTLWRRFRLPG